MSGKSYKTIIVPSRAWHGDTPLELKFPASWEVVLDKLKQVHGASARAAVIPDATIQYFPEGKNEPMGTLIQE
jgi:hypothetical protein